MDPGVRQVGGFLVFRYRVHQALCPACLGSPSWDGAGGIGRDNAAPEFCGNSACWTPRTGRGERLEHKSLSISTKPCAGRDPCRWAAAQGATSLTPFPRLSPPAIALLAPPKRASQNRPLCRLRAVPWRGSGARICRLISARRFPDRP